jgi:hypothetical protein
LDRPFLLAIAPATALRYGPRSMNRRGTSGGILVGLLIVAAVATALGQVAPTDEPSPPPAEPAAEPVDTDAGADVAEPEATDVAESEATDVAGPEASESEVAASAPPPRVSETSRVVQRRREAALVGGWVHSARDQVTGRFSVDDLMLGANGEWVRRTSSVDSTSGLAAPPAEASGTWFTEEGTLVLLVRGSAVDEVMRAAFQIDDRSERLVLELDGGPTTYNRYR